MPGYHVHSFFTAAVYDQDGRPIPAGLAEFEMAYAGVLLFMSDPSQNPANYDVYWSLSNVALGPFSQAYHFLGKVREFYAIQPGPMQRNLAAVAREGLSDGLVRMIRMLCGYGKPIHQFWAFSNPQGSLDLYVQTMGQRPADVFSHYRLEVADPNEWWRAQSYQYVGSVCMPDWAPPVHRSVL